MTNKDIEILNCDCIQAMNSKIVHGSVDCVITSPPYNVNLGNNKFKKDGYASYSDNLDYQDYLEWMKNVFIGCHKVLKEDGRICVNIGDGKNGNIPTHSDFIQILIEIGFKPITTIIWNKKTTSNRCAWGSWMSASCPSFPMQHEYILCLGKTLKRASKGISTIAKEDFIKWTNPIWEFKTETNMKKIGHPAMFPIELPYRCIQMFTYENDLVLDPFMGSGTTGVACIKSNRRFIGCEIEEQYCQIAKKRLAEEIC